MGGVQASSRISPNVERRPRLLRERDPRRRVGGADRRRSKEGTGRFDASDLMPSAVGSGSFWTEMVNYLRNGPDYAETALTNIEDSWPS